MLFFIVKSTFTFYLHWGHSTGTELCSAMISSPSSISPGPLHISAHVQPNQASRWVADDTSVRPDCEGCLLSAMHAFDPLRNLTIILFCYTLLLSHKIQAWQNQWSHLCEELSTGRCWQLADADAAWSILRYLCRWSWRTLWRWSICCTWFVRRRAQKHGRCLSMLVLVAPLPPSSCSCLLSWSWLTCVSVRVLLLLWVWVVWCYLNLISNLSHLLKLYYTYLISVKLSLYSLLTYGTWWL